MKRAAKSKKNPAHTFGSWKTPKNVIVKDFGVIYVDDDYEKDAAATVQPPRGPGPGRLRLKKVD